jgi:lipopolysaccharide/colanic/teichoic acid biosynthesis glycosyltransferase
MWRHDLEYLCRMSMRLDLWIIVQSALVALKRTGAT